jgi:hypothetical protein
MEDRPENIPERTMWAWLMMQGLAPNLIAIDPKSMGFDCGALLGRRQSGILRAKPKFVVRHSLEVGERGTVSSSDLPVGIDDPEEGWGLVVAVERNP